MFPQPSCKRAGVLALGLLATSLELVAAGPCDIYASGGTPCVAAHSTTRALYSNYTGPLYQVKRGSDSKTADISTLAAGGVADAAAQDSFCAKTTCLITIIYDQSGRGNHLTQAPPGGFRGPAANGYDNLASATGAPVTVNGQKAYGVFVAPGTGYRNNKASGTATGDAPEGMYAVVDGTHYNSACCFDYGNAETSSQDTGNGHMEAIYFGSSTYWGSGNGNGPWIMADLENGLFSGGKAGKNTNDPTISYRFTTAIVKGEPNQWAIRGADATAGGLSTFYSGARPANGYNPMKKEGAIILGIGGDNSNGAQGTFYEGAMTSGYPSDATENAVQADIVAAKYATSSQASSKALAPGTLISLRAATTTTSSSSSSSSSAPQYLTHNTTTAALTLQPIPLTTRSRRTAPPSFQHQQATWKVHPALGTAAEAGCISLESAAAPGTFLRHTGGGAFTLALHPDDGTKQFREDATFCALEGGLGGGGSDGDASGGDVVAIRSWNYPTRYLRRYGGGVYAASNGEGGNEFDAAAGFHEEVNWVVETGLAA
ncbi:glycoside hydrolase family 54 protein [Thermothielavioides terrestris NRRL 8126]|uniref:Alpha-L-arabinofuranosidase n=1 Tax=Thermothielavioides terrestris (strain ATCC 38088 / NRRL 8126) TaxID=578455 RepID=G2QWT5_THETT|nr:glycoside hydrolase family 54 protein [Thermothielavioides terrestris NRRL 8126]AEO63099.1 glycoside hydrolase family 54 protein [Thermothielavioides terrestris NRRL 8126]